MHPTLELIRNRNAGRPDEAVLAAVVEGGGLRGGFTAGNVAALEEAGYTANLFDIVIGASSGAYNAAYYAGNSSVEGCRIYSEHMVQNDFANYKAWLKGRPVMNFNVVLNHILEEVIPLDWQTAIDADSLHMVVSDPHKVGTKVLSPPKDKTELKNNLRATAHIPILGGRAPRIENLRYYDGSLTAPLPVEQAIGLGATHILALSSRSLKEWRNRQTRLERVVSRAYDLRYPGIDKAIRHGVETADERVEYLANARDNPQGPPYIYTIDTPEGIVVHQFERDTDKLAEIVELGKRAVKRIFEFGSAVSL